MIKVLIFDVLLSLDKEWIRFVYLFKSNVFAEEKPNWIIFNITGQIHFFPTNTNM